MQRSPRRHIPREKLTGCSYTEIIPCSVKGSNKMGLHSRTLRVKHQKRGVTQCRGHPEDRYQGRSLQDVLTQR